MPILPFQAPPGTASAAREGAAPEALSLSGLQDIALPAEPGSWPPAAGWWWLGAALSVSAILLMQRALARHRALAYQRVALAELRELVASGQLGDLPALLKRVALVTHARREVASLSGEPWIQFLARTGGRAGFDERAGRDLLRLAYASPAPHLEHTAEQVLTTAAAAWIRAQGPRPSERSR